MARLPEKFQRLWQCYGKYKGQCQKHNAYRKANKWENLQGHEDVEEILAEKVVEPTKTQKDGKTRH